MIAIESTQTRKTFAPHGMQAWYVCPKLEHYRCYKVYVPKTRAERIFDTVSFHPHLCKSPVLQPIEKEFIVANKLTSALKNLEKQNAPQYSKENKTIQALETLSNIFLQHMEHKRGINNTQYPRVIKFAKNPITPSPRVNQQTLAPKHVIPPYPSPTEHAPTRVHINTIQD